MCVKGVGESLKPRQGKGIDGLMQDMWADERTDSRSHSGLHKRILAEDKNTDWRFSLENVGRFLFLVFFPDAFTTNH